MDSNALEKAQSRLRLMRKATIELEGCTNFSDFTDAWFSFLTAFKSTYTTLEQGAKTSAQSRQWFGGRSNERRSDELLQYLYQARNDEEHGLENSAENVPGRIKLQLKIPASGVVDLSTTIIRAGEVHLPKAKLAEPAKLLEHVEPHIALRPVTARGSLHFPPPTTHQGVPLIEKSPLAVAKCGLTYLEGMVKEAEGLK